MSVFKCKQFEIEQNSSVFAVGTDALLCGSLAILNNATRVLEIGTGTGIIALMLQQRNPSLQITALEPHTESFQLAQQNFKKNALGKSISLFSESWQEWNSIQKFDLIVSNPPYFPSRTMPHQKHAHARSQIHLDFESVFLKSATRLSKDGSIQLIFPMELEQSNAKYAQKNGLFPQSKTYIQGHPKSKISRVFVKYGKEKIIPEVKNLTIEYNRGNFTEDYIALTKDFHPMF